MPGRIDPVSMGVTILPADFEDNVHAATLFHVLMLHTVQPQNLRIAVGKGPLAGAVGRAIIAAALGLAGAAPDRLGRPRFSTMIFTGSMPLSK